MSPPYPSGNAPLNYIGPLLSTVYNIPPTLTGSGQTIAIVDAFLSPTLLSDAQSLRFDSEGELRARLRPGIDGVTLELDQHRATFLPQVWDALPKPEDFLAALKHKAGIPLDFWSPRLNVALYQVTKWKERDDDGEGLRG